MKLMPPLCAVDKETHTFDIENFSMFFETTVDSPTVNFIHSIVENNCKNRIKLIDTQVIQSNCTASD